MRAAAAAAAVLGKGMSDLARQNTASMSESPSCESVPVIHATVKANILTAQEDSTMHLET